MLFIRGEDALPTHGEVKKQTYSLAKNGVGGRGIGVEKEIVQLDLYRLIELDLFAIFVPGVSGISKHFFKK